MANLKELKKKIRSTKGTFKITTAMKLVSAAKLARAQVAIVGARPYSDGLERTIKTVAALAQDYQHPFLREATSNRHAHLLVISSNKGLCGGYNSQLVKVVRGFLQQEDMAAQGTGESGAMEVKVHYMGKKAREMLSGEVVNQGVFHTFEKQEPTYLEVVEVARQLAQDFESGEVGQVLVAYNVFHSAISFTPMVKKLLPITFLPEEKKELQEKWPFDFKYEPRAAEILDTLIPEAYANTVYTCLLDALAAEHGLRMSSMDSAANNCKDLIKKLTLRANKLRQAAITTELIEVVSGAESLSG